MIENQLSTKFKGIYLGFSKVYTINDSGCLTACISRLLNLPLLEVHQKLKDSGCFFNECLLDLTKVPTAYPQLTYKGKFTYDNDLALKTIKEQGIVIAEVDYNPIMNGTQQHFICMVGNGNIEDPLGGKIKSVTTYKTYLTLRVFEIKELPVEETMTEQEKHLLEVITELKASEGDIREGVAYVKAGTIKEKDKQILILTNKVADLEVKMLELSQALENLRLNFIEKEKQEIRWQKQIDSANTKLNEQILKNEDLDKLAKDNRNLYLKKNDEFNAYKESEKQQTIKSLSLLQFIKLKYKK